MKSGTVTQYLNTDFFVVLHLITEYKCQQAFYMANNFDNKGWDIDRTQLRYPETKSLGFDVDKLFENQDKDFACLFYNIDEYRMGFYGGLISIFENKEAPKLLANPKNQWFDLNSHKPLIFFDNFLFLRKLAYNSDENLSGTPFAIFDVEKKIFGFLDFDASSVYYSLIKIYNNTYKINLDNPEGLKNLRVMPTNRHGEIFDMTTIKLYPFGYLDKMTEIYFADKKKNAC